MIPEPYRRVAVVGGLASAVLAMVLWAVPTVVEWDPIRTAVLRETGIYVRHNPLDNLWFLASLPGALFAGYHAEDDLGYHRLDAALAAGLASVGVALVALYFAYLVGLTVLALATSGQLPPLWLTVVSPALLGVPLVPAFGVEGLLGGAVGNAVRRLGVGD